MFENDLAELDAAGTLAAAEVNEHTLITAETRRLQIAAHWADLHPGDAVAESRLPGSERPAQLGGDGTPTVGDFAPAELGCVLRTSDGSASRLIADALDLRHRLPRIWAAALAGQVPAYQARYIATATRQLPAEQAGFVDQRIAPSLGAVSFGRLQTLVETAIIDADPEAAEQRAAAAAQERFVRLGSTSEHGLKLIIAPRCRRRCPLVQSHHRPDRRHSRPRRRHRHHRRTAVQGDWHSRPACRSTAAAA